MGEPTVGTILAELYRLIAPIGGGAMGTVWRAARVDGGDDVAIKILSTQLEERPDLVERFEREATLARDVDHPNVCRVFGHGKTDEGHRFLVIELLEGQSLAERLDSTPPITAAELVEGIIAIVDGLAAVHEAGVVHRDLKPDNIFLTEADGAKLIDFGVSKGGEAMQKLTATGEVLGTPVFMAPEQADSAKAAEPSADVYGIGAILYDALAGRPPFESKSLAMLLLAVAFEEPVPLEEVRPGVPIEIATLVHETMAKAPNDRPPSAAALGEALRALFTAHREALEQLELPREWMSTGPDNGPNIAVPRVAESESLDVGAAAIPTRNGPLIAGIVVALLALGAVVAITLL